MSQPQGTVTVNGPSVEVPQAPVTRWAVTQTGYITSAGDMTVFMDDDGRKLPQLIRIVDDEATARKMLSRLEASHQKVTAFKLKNAGTTRPIYGIAEVETKAKKPRKELTPQQKEAMAKRLSEGRKRARVK